MTRGHTFSMVFLCLVISTGIWLSYTVSVSAFSILEMLGIGTDETEETVKPTGQKQDKPSAEKPKSLKQGQSNSPQKLKAGLRLSDVRNILSVVDQNKRKKILADENTFNNFVKQEASNASVLTAARANKIEISEQVQILAQRSVDNIVRETYLNQLVASKIPADFPTDKQVQEYYDKNKDNFVIEERVHTWQIFLPIKEDMSVKDIELLKKKAESITNNLKKKKTDFVSAANKHSKHEASRLSGGYMGLIKISEFKPEIKAAIKTLKQGDISKPIKTDDGIHILKRGAIVPKQDITLEQVKPKITELMLKQLRIQIRQAVFKQASITYPVDLDDKNMEEWRLKLRTN
ncbi:MAG: peptidyl-prolyl cis-trans isomerase [Proteobacteria bacterium]|nr:peptidyl-prolyl cis-trans isomerase [Pseudomonadota bacterium]